MNESAKTPPQKPINKKLQQFIDEINSLSQKYQYQIKPCLKYTKEGIFANLEIVEIIPKKEKNA